MAEIKKPFPVPEAVTGYFDRKVLKPSFSWLDVYGQEHANAMTVAGAVELEVLEAFRSTLSASLGKGEGLETWKGSIASELTRLGWFGPRLVKDPLGIDPDKLVNYASDRRLKLIFWSNMNAARAAGQWERAQKSKAFLPYLLYVRTTSAEPRPEHLAFAGTILSIDHPFWDTHFPPNGWLCKCTVRQITRREAGRLIEQDGYSGQPPEAGPDRPHVNRRTGQVEMIPEGIDPGWHTNPGRTRTTTLIRSVSDRLEAAGSQDATRVLTELWSDPFFKIAPRLPGTVFLPAGRSERLASELAAISPVISITNRTIAERVSRHKLDPSDFEILPQVLSQGVILPDIAGKDNVRTILIRIGKTLWRVFVNRSANGYLRVNSFHQKNADELRRQLKRAGIKWPFEE
jgi:SPP1 gp7 family putative phage head morphogenesis protein